MKLFGVSGWAVPPVWFQNLLEREIPHCHIETIYPHTSTKYDHALQNLQNSQADIYIGYSLGSLWLMKHREIIPENSLVCCLAPILAYPKENSRGGKIEMGRLDYLKKWIRRNPGSFDMILEFLKECPIPLTSDEIKLLPESEILIEGLNYLKNEEVKTPDPGNSIYLVGDNDPFLSASQLLKEIDGLVVVEQGRHDPVLLVRALIKQKPWNDFFESEN